MKVHPRQPLTVRDHSDGMPPSMRVFSEMSVCVLDFPTFDCLRDMLSPSLLAETYRTFLDHTGERLAALRRAPDVSTLREAGHSLRGTAGMLGATHLADLAGSLEHTTATGTCLDAELTALDRACFSLEAALRGLQVSL